MQALRSELFHLSGVKIRVQKVKPKMAEFEGALRRQILVLCAVNVHTETYRKCSNKRPGRLINFSASRRGV